ncbi:MAG: hypothetical protein CBC05_08850 [Crocinitomicaceae bacterium TMED45]|nr:MAG: hypothetical protein CBC05_08850 [Crocinitomicaceae bacterium TMED45]|tara:strand:- start:12054 stop:12299 length:246 start_codon:yes stop_codon:yes gene_type:complete
MNIKKDFTPSDRPSAIDAMDHGMSYLWENFIEPKIQANEHKEIDIELLAQLGIIFKDIAEKAEAYYAMEEKKFTDSHNYLN